MAQTNPPTDPCPPFVLNANAFSKCAPAIGSNIKQCGTVTQCCAKPATTGDLSDIYLKSNDFRVLGALFHHDMEIKMCEAVQNGLYDFLMANKVALRRGLTTRRRSAGLLDVAPFVMARQFSPINDEYWKVSNGAAVPAEAHQWSVRVSSTTNIPASTQRFPVGLRVFIMGKSPAGSATRTAWTVVSATLANDASYVTLVLQSGNAGSKLEPLFADKLHAPVTGLMTLGTPNVSDYERWCNESPSYLNWKNVPFWVETTRDSLCRSSLYAKWRRLVLEDNDLYKEFFDLDEIQKNRQIGANFQKRIVQQMFWGKATDVNQTLADYDNLPEITLPSLGLGADSPPLDILGVEGGRCIGKRADMIGIYEQHAECGRVLDLQGGILNIPALAKALYNMMRVRKANGTRKPMEFDLFTDSVYAELLNQAFIKYYNDKSDGMLRLNMNVEGNPAVAREANFGFYYRRFPLFWPQGVVINVIWHEAFDDLLAAAVAADPNMEDTTRICWLLDFSGIYPGIIASNRRVNKTGDLNTMAKVNSDAACVMEVENREWTHYSMLMTMIVECTMGNLIIENIANTIPSIVPVNGLDYDSAAGGGGTTTTTSTAVV